MTSPRAKKPALRWFLLQLPLWSLLLLLVCVALLVLLIRFLLPQLDSTRPDLEAWLNQQLPFNVQSQQLTASLYRIDPRFVIDELTLSHQGQPFLQLQHLEAEVDSWSSLLAWAPRMQEVRLQGLEIWLQETTTGWHLAGWEEAEQSGLEALVPPDTKPLSQLLDWLELLLVQGELDLADITVNLQPLAGDSLQLSSPHLNYRRWNKGRQLDFQLGLEGGQASSRLVVTLEGDRFDIQESRLDAWLNLEQLQMEDLHALWPASWQEQLGWPEGRVSLQAWLRLDQGQVELEVRSDEGELQLRPGVLAFQDLALSLSGQDQNWQADWQLADLNWSRQSLTALQGRVHYDQQTWQLLMKSLSLSEIKSLLIAVPELPDWLLDLLADLDPQGQLQNLHLSWGEGQPWQLTSLLDAVSVGAWSAAPAVENLDAWLEASAQAGRVVFQQQPLSVFFPDFYAQPFALSSGRGEVSWRLDQDEVWVEGRHLAASLPLPEQEDSPLSSRVTGDFSFQLTEQDRRLYLNLGLQSTSVAAHQQLVPGKLLPEEVYSWLQTALKSGDVSKGGFIFAGSVEPDSPASFQVQLDFKDASLAFDPAWPELTQLDGWVRVDNGLVQGQASQGRLLEAELQQSDFATSWQGQGQQLLDVQAQFTSELSLFPELIVNSPLQEWVPEPLHTWRYQGQSRGALQIKVPFYDQPDDLQVDLRLEVDQGQVYLSQADLQLDKLEGLLSFSLDQGLAGTRFSGQVWEEPFNARIQGENNQLSFAVTPSLPNLLNWLEWPAWPWAEGNAAVHGEWVLNPLGALKLNSNLKGISLALPEPFAKLPDQQQPLHLSLGFDQDEIPLLLRLGDQLQVTTHLASAEQGVAVNLASKEVMASGLPGSPGVSVDARLDKTDLDELLRWWQNYYGQSTNPRGVENPSEAAGFLPAHFRELNARISEGFWQQTPLGPIHLHLQEEDGLQLQVTSNPLIGRLRWQEPGAVIQLDLDRIKLPPAEPQVAATLDEPRVPGSRRLEKLALRREDPWADMQPEQWPDIDWTLASLERGQVSLGRWQGRIKTDPQQLAVTQVQGDLGQSRIRGELVWQLEPISRTQLEMQVSGNNPRRALAAVSGGKSPLISESHLLEGLISWPGSPAAFFLPAAEGEMELLFLRGHFPETEGAALGASRFFGLMNLDNLVRRMRLDFSDVTTQGVSFDRLEASYQLEEGYLRSLQPAVMQSSATRIRLTGEIDLLEETLDQQLRVTLPVGQALPLAAVVMGAPQIGALIWLGQKFVGLFFDTRREALYDIQGPINQPEVKLKTLR